MTDETPALGDTHLELLVTLLYRSPEFSVFDPPEWFVDTWPEPYEDLVDWGLIEGIRHGTHEDGSTWLEVDAKVRLTDKGRKVAETAVRQRSPSGGRAFVSYVREDAREIDSLCAHLDASGLLVWRDIDQLLPGDEWKVAIRRAIETGACFIACFSLNSESRSRSYMRAEVTLAVEELRQRPVDSGWFIPVLLDDVDMPELPIGAGRTLRDLHYIRWYESSQEAVEKILKSVARRSGGPPR